MKKFFLFLAVAFAAISSVAQTAYGFLTGSGNTGLEVGLYSFNVQNGRELTPVSPAMYGLWGGAGDGTDYYCLLSADYDGYQMAGLAAFDCKSGEWDFRSTSITYACADLTFDVTTGSMYGVVCKEGGSKVPAELVVINLENGECQKVAALDDKIMAIAADADGNLFGLSSAADLYRINKKNGSLTLVGNTGITAASDQVQSMEFDRDAGKLYWTAVDTEYDAFIVQLDMATGLPLQRAAVDDNTLLGGLYIPFTTQGGGSTDVQVPDDLTSLSVRSEGSAAILEWTDENPSGTLYRITRQPDGKVFEGIAAKSFTDDTAAEACYFTYSVAAYNAAGSSNALKSSAVLAGHALPLPYTMDFANPFAVAQWLVVDANADGVCWKANAGNFQYFGSFFKQGDDWLMSVPFHLEQGRCYRLSYTVQCPSILGSSENLQVSLGTSAEPSSHTRVLETLESFNASDPTLRTVEFVADATADFMLGFKAFSQPDQFQILISSISLTSFTDNDLAVDMPEGDFLAVAESPYACTVKVSNVGQNTMQGFKVRLLDEEQQLLQEVAVDEALESGAEKSYTLSFTPHAVGTQKLYAEVMAADDRNPDNDFSSPFLLEVRPATERIIRIGENNASPFLLPIAFEGYYYSFSQGIYWKEEMDCPPALLKEIGFRYYSKAAAPIEERHLKLALANTEQFSPTEGWIEENALTTAFDGNVTFGVGTHTLRLPFSEPFHYDGGNLCVMLTKLRDATFQEVHFDATDHPGDVRTAFGYNDSGAIVLSEINGSSMLADIYVIAEPVGSDGIAHAAANQEVGLLPAGANRFRIMGDGIGLVEVFSADGRRCLSQSAADMLCLDHLTPGIYVVKINATAGSASCKVSVK